MTPRPDPRRLLTPPRDRGWYHHRGRPPRQQHSTTENPIISAAKQNDTNCSGSTTPQDYSSMIAPIDNSKYTTSRILNTNYVHKAFPVIILPWHWSLLASLAPHPSRPQPGHQATLSPLPESLALPFRPQTQTGRQHRAPGGWRRNPGGLPWSVSYASLSRNAQQKLRQEKYSNCIKL
mgnify:CR=1 FL=1